MLEKNVSFKEAGRVSRYIGKAYQMFFASLNCPIEVVEQEMEEHRHLAFRSQVTKILIKHLKMKPDTTFAEVADAMTQHGMKTSALPRIFDCNRDTTCNVSEEILPGSRLQRNLSVSDVSIIAQHLDSKAYPNLFMELGFSPQTIDKFDVDFKNKQIGVQICAMLEEFIKHTNSCPTVNTVLLAMQECNMDSASLIKAMTPTKTTGVTVCYQRNSVLPLKACDV
ncbi:uncharacterized protein LOC117324817 [Pecten maximus]|uniref:uncharacterized protein LOC117324817 n=1 Tax=Pecten maximus TaxID=6579 RepID=UPI001458EA8B|nr:uncharacterized protein LOC117324817 [Pecten maximus]